ncbi:MAG: aminoglycoside phosphotransferase [Rhodospirillaceae bacterium]|nr:aminoglycoside phosphotransferase [Rhodospirillaceae bacterium]|tara:strand:+ start:17679 stop:18689 length:1011 start_codon:yes stop_codon:yes gene_type:complete
MANRTEQINEFLESNGWGGVSPQALTGDASFRRYFRLQDGERRAMLMDAPPPKENVVPFLEIARHLSGLGYSAPEIYAEDQDAGFILLEDFGDATFTHLLSAGTEEKSLYLLATDVLIDLHRRPMSEAVPKNLPEYDLGKLMSEAELFTDWFIPWATGGTLSENAKTDYRNNWQSLLSDQEAIPTSLVLRDYHVDNLMRLDNSKGIAACGLLDFQDAVVGPVTYDVMSLIEDARRDVSPETAAAVKARYLEAFPAIDPVEFDRSIAILGAQRHAKVIGIFTRLCVRDEKPVYLDHIPRVWRLLEAACGHADLKQMKRWLDEHVPSDKRSVPEGFET